MLILYFVNNEREGDFELVDFGNWLEERYQVVHVLDKVGIQERGVLDHRRVGAADELEARLVLVHAV